MTIGVNHQNALKFYEDAQNHSHLLHVLIFMAHTETLKAIDMIDDGGLRRQVVKQFLNKYEERYAAYKHFMYERMTKQTWSLLQDYCLWASDKAGYRLLMLRQGCYNYLKKKGVERAKLLAQCEVALLLWHIEKDTFTVFFDSYKQVSGVDFRKDFSYADLSRCVFCWHKVVDELCKGIRGVDFGEDRRCTESWQALKDEIDNADFFGSAAYKALTVNKDLAEKYLDKTEG